MNWNSSEFSTHFHCALYAAIALAAVLLHGNQPIEGTSSKVTIILMCGLILAESASKAIRVYRSQDDGGPTD